LYALRDVTATVEAIPLIASSIMSKKIAEGTSALVLDVKTGAGAFMSDPEKAKELAHVMVGLGKRAGVKTLALVTAMDIPLGLTAGNALEIRESVEVLAGGGPADIVELTVLLAQEMLELVGIKGVDPAAALKNGKAMDVWRQMISAQGGDPDAKLPVAKENTVVTAQSSGTILSMDAMKVGVAAWRLGAGRSRQGEAVQAGAGIEIHVKPGEAIQAGSPLYTLHTDTPAAFARALESLENSVTIGSVPAGGIDRLPLVIERIVD
jgi:thymidine phosphorylase